ncbi:chemotaxis response regulator protein-glutamate methylesterase [Methylomonas sp. UP202]|uniref:protein-glutamate methylesterase/protein-glutamine glutaminase n=1 Tax=Methylomonas sp. UP202 TaxID=3040943 RepID=UPI00143AAF71|nr:chemotaxis response regulator protein-glutamate methylesterase [Methylomonas sp. UP202]NJA08417.1 chemotaxis response regulator protein-glutamate methylesterase [Methylococcaceae bacterium WWC4]WGS86581.1 chemotaxis response regulator protein-glutamate methylesterase [Methylomonas sp. UP202]
MTIRVLVVDDSDFICKRIRDILEEEPDFKVVGIAANGKEAVRMAALLMPDVITMDVDMPVMDGITAVRQIMATRPCPILMFSAMTQVGAKATLDALEAGALDFLPKQLEDIDANRKLACQTLRLRLRLLAAQARRMPAKPVAGPSYSPLAAPRPADVERHPAAVLRAEHGGESIERIDLLVIAASTGGPMAIQDILTHLPQACRFPIVLIQHMPAHFTKSYADRLNQLCGVGVREAQDHDELQNGVALLAPGGVQTEFVRTAGKLTVALRNKTPGELYAPGVDVAFASLAAEFKGRMLAVVLTGMGSDGREGAKQLKRAGAAIWAQDERSCVVYGMPRAIAEAGLADKIYSLSEIANQFKRLH